MKRLSSLLVAVPLVVAACAGGSSESSSGAVTTSTGDDDLNILELKCRDGRRIDGSRLDVRPSGNGTLQATLLTDEGEATLLCTPTHVKGDDGISHLLVQCVESERSDQQRRDRPGDWTVKITSEADGRQTARIERHELLGGPGNGGPEVGGEGPDVAVVGEDLACSRITSEIPVLPYSVVAGYIHRTCNVCHDGRFDTLEKVRAQRDLMFGLISGGIMPKRNPTWRTTDEGKLTLAFLANSPELD